MNKNTLRKKLSLFLVFVMVLGVSGNAAAPDVQAAAAATDPMLEIAQEEAEKEALFKEEEPEYPEEPEDYSWMDKLLEEQRLEEADAELFRASEEPAPENVQPEPQFETQPEPPSETQPEPPSETQPEAPDEPEDAAVFDDGSAPVFGSPEESAQPEGVSDDPFDAGESEDLFSADEENDSETGGSEIGESEAVLKLNEGEDFITELNILLYKVKDLATDDHPYKVIIPPGNYEIKGTISLYSNIHLYAVGAVMKKTSAKKQILLRLGNSETSAGGYDGYRNITIEGGTWDCNYASCENKEESGGFVGFRIGHATNVTIKNATFLNNLKSHFLEFGGVKNALVTGCTFRGYWTAYEATNQECIQIDACMDGIFPRYAPFDGTVCTDIVVENNRFENVFCGVGSHSMMFNKPYTNITIRNNVFKNVKKRAIWLLNCRNSTVTGNTLQNVGGGIYISSVRQSHAQMVPGQKATSSQNQYSMNVTVSNNRITLAQTTTVAGTQWRSYGIHVGGQLVTNPSYGIPKGDYVIRGVTVTQNTVSGTGNGIRLERAASCKVTSNTVTVKRPKGYTNFGIYIGGSRNNQITGNRVSGAANIGIYVYTTASYSYGSTGNKLVSNQVKNCASDGIRLGDKSNTTTLQKNVCTGNSRNGIHVRSSVVTSMTSNQCTSNGEAGIYGYKSAIRSQKANRLQANKSAYAIRFSGCKGQVQNVKNISLSARIKSSSRKVTGTCAGGVRMYVYAKSNMSRLGTAKVGKNSKYTVPIRAQKKGRAISVRTMDKYGNLIIRDTKVY